MSVDILNVNNEENKKKAILIDVPHSTGGVEWSDAMAVGSKSGSLWFNVIELNFLRAADAS